MTVPQNQYLTSQSFNSKKLEFVWQFPTKNSVEKTKNQFILQIELNPVIYMEAGVVNEAGDYIEEPTQFKLGYGHLNPGDIITSELNWPEQKFPEVYKNFTNGQDLVALVKDSVKYLQSI